MCGNSSLFHTYGIHIVQVETCVAINIFHNFEVNSILTIVDKIHFRVDTDSVVVDTGYDALSFMYRSDFGQ